MPRASSTLLSTDRELRSAAVERGRAEFRIAGARNLVLRVAENGTKSWLFLYAAPATGKRKKIALGRYPTLGLADARAKAARLSAQLYEKVDPRLGEKDEDLSYQQLANAYLNEHGKRFAKNGRPSTWSLEVERILVKDVFPAIGEIPANSLTRKEVAHVVDGVAGRGALVHADRVLGVVRAVYNWANGTGKIECDPTRGLKKRNAGNPRQRYLSDSEIKEFWAYLDCSSVSTEISSALKLQLLLGLRVSEATEARREEISLDDKTWTIPPERNKSNRTHRLPIPPLAHSILTSASALSEGSEWIFPSAVQSGPIEPKSAQRAMLRMQHRTSIKGVGTHDLRRTLATGLGRLETADEIIERVLNHAPRTVTNRHYNHARYDRQILTALTMWDHHVQKLLRS